MAERHAVPADFFARRTHFVDHLAPVWKVMDWRGKFYVPDCLYEYALSQDIQDVMALKPVESDPLAVAPPGGSPLVTCAYHDMMLAQKARPQRRLILMEHGVGLVFGINHSGYAGGLGLRRRVKLFLSPNEYIRAKTAKSLPHAAQVVVGCPKLDEWGLTPNPSPFASPKYGDRQTANGEGRKKRGKPVVCISFHWNGAHIEPEAGSAFEHYRKVLPELARQADFKLIGHGHPKIIDLLANEYEENGIEVVRDFREVMRRADIYVNDCSSTMYEFLTTGKPVVIMNAPQFRKNKNFGIRFWLYVDIGSQVEGPEELIGAIEATLQDPMKYQEAREKAVKDLFPYLGCSATRAAAAIQGYCGSIYG
jgi:hypothetical protein